MTRINDREYTHRPCDDRAVSGVELDFMSEVDADDALVRDVELGIRASEKLDGLEELSDITYWADLAQTEAMNRGENR